jgi:hypothetical protein
LSESAFARGPSFVGASLFVGALCHGTSGTCLNPALGGSAAARNESYNHTTCQPVNLPTIVDLLTTVDMSTSIDLSSTIDVLAHRSVTQSTTVDLQPINHHQHVDHPLPNLIYTLRVSFLVRNERGGTPYQILNKSLLAIIT